jgi:hypothetical protein
MRFLSRAFLLWITVTAAAQGRPASPAQAPATPATATMDSASRVLPPFAAYHFPDGQSLSYDAEWRLWTAGSATFTMEAAGTSHKITGIANSTGVVSVLYTVRDRFESTFDGRTFCSERIFKHTEEGTRKRDTNILFDYKQRKAILDEKNLKTNETKHQAEDIGPCVTDVLSGVFHVASLPLAPNAVYMFPLNDGGKQVDVKATVEGKEQIKTTAGTFNTIRVRTEADSGPLKKRGSLWLWYSDDNNRIPVQMRARAFWGTLNLKLTRIEQKK